MKKKSHVCRHIYFHYPIHLKHYNFVKDCLPAYFFFFYHYSVTSKTDTVTVWRVSNVFLNPFFTNELCSVNIVFIESRLKAVTQQSTVL